jgi:hypothetical protein
MIPFAALSSQRAANIEPADAVRIADFFGSSILALSFTRFAKLLPLLGLRWQSQPDAAADSPHFYTIETI